MSLRVLDSVARVFKGRVGRAGGGRFCAWACCSLDGAGGAP